jgi:hypothetical protein
MVQFAGSTNGNLISSAVFRDTTEWYHVVFSYDSSRSASERTLVYVNGISIPLTGTNWNGSPFTSLNVSGQPFDFGRRSAFGNSYFNGYLSEIHFVDGQALAPTDFGQTDPVTGKWAPKAYAGTYGANGFRLNFGNASTIGEDSAPLGGSHPAANHWTANNF